MKAGRTRLILLGYKNIIKLDTIQDLQAIIVMLTRIFNSQPIKYNNTLEVHGA